jgi:hypothetical protein
MGYYRQVAIETHRTYGEPSRHSIRARPLPGQGFPRDMHVECSARMRESEPVGTIFLVYAQEKSRLGGPDFLYTSWQWEWKVLTPDEAEEFISSRNR